MPSLTITVPTWNRASKLDACLGRLAEWAARYPELIIRVHDNASTDATPTVMAKWLPKFNGRLTYYRHERNLGLIGNYISCLKAAVTKHVWVMGDDDAVSRTALDRLWEILDRENDCQLVALNYRPYDGLREKEIAPAAFPRELGSRFPYGRDCFEACFRYHYGSMMFITACIYSQNTAVRAVEEFTAPLTNLALPFYVAGVCAASGKMRVVDDVCFDGYYNVASWRDHAFNVFRVDLPEVLMLLVKQFSYGKGLLQPHMLIYGKPRTKIFSFLSRKKNYRAAHLITKRMSALYKETN